MTCFYSDLVVETNTAGLKKISLSESGIKSYNSWIDQHARWQLGCGKDEEYNAQRQWRESNGKQAEILYGNSDVRIYQEVKFAGKNYYMFLCDDDIIIVNKENKKQVKNFPTGKTLSEFSAFILRLKDQRHRKSKENCRSDSRRGCGQTAG
jgi:hypothetical protein